MGMDIYGRNPTAEVGYYFRCTIHYWPTLWGYCVSVSPAAASLGDYGFSNDGYGLDAEDAKKLAATLREELASGATKEVARKIEQRELSPPWPPIMDGMFEFAKAFNLDVVTPPPGLNEELVRKFADFLEHCGGFKIW
jgi:hypothetical protein